MNIDVVQIFADLFLYFFFIPPEKKYRPHVSTSGVTDINVKGYTCSARTEKFDLAACSQLVICEELCFLDPRMIVIGQKF